MEENRKSLVRPHLMTPEDYEKQRKKAMNDFEAFMTKRKINEKFEIDKKRS